MRRFLGYMTVIALSSLMGPAARAQTVFADDFNTDTPGLAISPSFPNWNVTAGSIDIIGSGPGGGLFNFYPGNGYFIDLDGSAQGTIATASSFLLSPGDYTFSFSLGKNGSAAKSMTVIIGGVYSETFSDAGGAIPALVPVSRTFSVGAPTSVNIQFASNTPGNAGYVIDTVSLVAQTIRRGVAPEPASLALVGVVGLVAFGLRRRKAA